MAYFDGVQASPTLYNAELKHLKSLIQGGKLEPSESEIVLELQQLRNKALTENDFALYVEMFESSWKLLASEAAQKELNLPFPQRYSSSIDSNSFQQLLYPIFAAKQFCHGKSSNLVGSIGTKILYGQRGVGKTSLLRVIFSLAYLLTDHMVIVYWDYDKIHGQTLETLPTPKELISSQIERSINDTVIMDNFKNKKLILILADGIHDLYEDLSTKDIYGEEIYHRKVEIVRQLAAIGIGELTLVYACGSSINTANYCLHPDLYGLKDYVSLSNGTCNQSYFIQPVRSRNGFRVLLKEMMIANNITDDVIENIMINDKHIVKYFQRSGGVCRTLNNIIRQLQSMDRPTLLPEYYYSDDIIKIIMNYMCLNVASAIISLDNFDPWKHNHKIFRNTIIPIIRKMKKCDEASARKILFNYIDKNIFCQDSFGDIEYMYPAHLEPIANFQIYSSAQFRFISMESIMIGWNPSLPCKNADALKDEVLFEAFHSLLYVCTTYFLHLQKYSNLHYRLVDSFPVDCIHSYSSDQLNNEVFYSIDFQISRLEAFFIQVVDNCINIHILNKLSHSVSLPKLMHSHYSTSKNFAYLYNAIKSLHPQFCVESKELLYILACNISTPDYQWLIGANPMFCNNYVPLRVVNREELIEDFSITQQHDRLRLWMNS